MNGYMNSIDTDAAIGSILSNFETPWIMHTIQDSLDMKFRPFSEAMPNFVDILERQFEVIKPQAMDYIDKVEETRLETYKEIIGKICEYYNLSFTEDLDSLHPTELHGVARTMYDIFVSNFTYYMIKFYINYIVANLNSIYEYLSKDPDVRKVKEKENLYRNYIDPKFLLVHQNLNTVVLNMTTYDIPLDMLFSYFLEPTYANRMSQLLVDKGDIYKNYYAVYLKDQRYMADVLTVIKLELQSVTQSGNYPIVDPDTIKNEEEITS
ncbi:MAG: hypothetical protein IKR19_08545 [Acholeplasmatales bacterium]|nr:hypothetical protein [Acholeplasmatales bacterium]